MHVRRVFGLFIVLFVAVCVLPGAGAQEAPAFRLPGLDGKEYTLTDFRGRPVVLSFFTTWCPYCERELPLLEKLYREYREKASLLVLGVDLQEPEEKVRRFVEGLDLSFPVLLDERGETAFSYRIFGLPTLFFIDPQGNIADVILGGSDEATIRRKLDRILWFRGLLLPEVRNLLEVLEGVVLLDLREHGTNPFPEKPGLRYETVTGEDDLSHLDPQGVYVILAATSAEGKAFAASLAARGFRHVYYLLVDGAKE